MTHRHIFRMTYYKNIERFLKDGALYAKNHQDQPQFSISYGEINNKRGNEFKTPDDESLHDYLPFYFSPITAMAYAIHRKNVTLKNQTGEDIGKANSSDVVYIVSNIKICAAKKIPFWFTNVACNTAGAKFKNDLNYFKNHIKWDLFDEYPMIATISEIKYQGVCKWTQDRDDGKHSNRSAERMAEFMIKDSLSIGLIDCIIVNNDVIKTKIDAWMENSNWDIPVYVNEGCYF